MKGKAAASLISLNILPEVILGAFLANSEAGTAEEKNALKEHLCLKAYLVKFIFNYCFSPSRTGGGNASKNVGRQAGLPTYNVGGRQAGSST